MIKLKKPNVIFFDLDDTLTAFDSIGPHAWEQVCGQFVVKHNVNFTKEELIQSINRIKVEYWKDPIKHKWGREHLRQARREVACLSLKALGCVSKSLGNMLGDEYTSLQDSMIHTLPRVQEALDYFKQQRIRMAVITNGKADVQREKIQRFGLQEYFEYIFIDTEVGHSKPALEMYDYALKTMGVLSVDAVMVGDNLNWDVYGAQQAGIFAIWNDYKKQGLDAESTIIPDAIVTSVFEMTYLF